MRVLIDGHMMGTNEGGNERYTKNLFLHLLKDKRIDVKLSVSSQYRGVLKKEAKKRSTTQRIDDDLYRLLYFLPREIKKNNIDIVHCNYILPLYKTTKSAVTIHDVCFKRYPQFYSMREKFIFNILLPYSLSMAAAIIVPSYFTKKELIHFFPQHENKIFVTHEAADEVFCPMDKKKTRSVVHKRFNITEPYLMAFNSKNPKKNVNTVIEAFLLSLNNNPKRRLVIVGSDKNINDDLKKLQRISFYKNISDEDLNYLYNGADALIYYSIYEGFGLPILEALQCNTPIIVSHIEPHREITRDLLLSGNPFDPRDLLHKIELISNKKVRSSIIEKGKRVIGFYSWRKTVEQTIKAYKFAMKQ